MLLPVLTDERQFPAGKARSPQLENLKGSLGRPDHIGDGHKQAIGLSMPLALKKRREGRFVKAGERAIVDGPWPFRLAQPIARERREQLPDRAANLRFAGGQILPCVEKRYHAVTRRR